MQELLEAYPIIDQVGPWVGGAIGGSLLLILRSRRPLLTYHVLHQRIGMSAEDEIHGKVEVTYRGTIVHNLFLSVVTVKNRSIKDLENLKLKTYRGDNNMELLTEETAIEGTIEPVNLTQEYSDRILEDTDWEQQVREAGTTEEPNNKKRLEADYQFRHGQRHYTVPFLNRGQSLRITYLVHAAPNTMPVIYMTCNTKGVRIKEKPYPQAITHLWGVPIVQAARVGIVVALVVYGLVVWQITTLWLAALICVIVGVLANIPGALLVRIYNWLRGKIIG